MADKGSLLMKYGVTNPSGLSSVVDGHAWSRFLWRRQDILDVALPFAVMTPILIPLLLVLILAFSLRGDYAFAWVFVVLIGADFLALSMFLHARSQESAIATVEDAERVRLEALIVAEFGSDSVDSNVRLGALQSVSWSKDGMCYSVDYDEATSQYSLSSSAEGYSASLSKGSLRRLLQLI